MRQNLNEFSFCHWPRPSECFPIKSTMTLLPGPYANEPGTHFTLSPVPAKINYQPSVELELVV